MATILPATVTVQIAASGKKATVASLPVGVEIAYQGVTLRILARHMHSGKVRVEPTQPKEKDL